MRLENKIAVIIGAGQAPGMGTPLATAAPPPCWLRAKGRRYVASIAI